MLEQYRSIPQPRDIASLCVDEIPKYCAVPGWRVWPLGMFSKRLYTEAARIASVKPLALKSTQFDPGKGLQLYNELYKRYRKANRLPSIFGRGSFDLPYFILEPLTEEEVRRIHEEGQATRPLSSIDKPEELIRPEDLQRILDPHQDR
jgi:hypothetical protein